jgi:hypothetical protein
MENISDNTVERYKVVRFWSACTYVICVFATDSSSKVKVMFQNEILNYQHKVRFHT